MTSNFYLQFSDGTGATFEVTIVALSLKQAVCYAKNLLSMMPDWTSVYVDGGLLTGGTTVEK